MTSTLNQLSSFYQRLPHAIPHSLVEVGVSAATLNSFSTHLLETGWSGLLLERNSAVLSHLETTWKARPDITCLHFDGQAIKPADSDSHPLADLLHKSEIPADCGLLILNDPEGRVDLIHELMSANFRPWLVALREQSDIADQRHASYSLLSSHGYRFAGIEQDFSLWTRSGFSIAGEPLHLARTPGEIREGFGTASFDTPTSVGKYTATRHLDLAVAGWAFLDEASRIPESVYVEVKDLRSGTVEYVEATRRPRLDVARHFNNSDLLMCGFHATISMRRLYPNGMRLRVVQCDNNQCYAATAELTIQREIQNYEQTARQDLARKFLRGSGIEIGALQRKLELPDNCKVRYVDRMAMQDLLLHYPELHGLRLQAPDLIDDGERLDTIAANSLDFVVANHFFEHCENPIQTLKNLLSVLKASGLLFMAVPDKRYTFDFQRPSTSYDRLKSTFEQGFRVDRDLLYTEWVSLVEMNTGPDHHFRVRELLESNYSIHFNVWSTDELLQFLWRARVDFKLLFNFSSVVCSDNETILLLEHVT